MKFTPRVPRRKYPDSGYHCTVSTSLIEDHPTHSSSIFSWHGTQSTLEQQQLASKIAEFLKDIDQKSIKSVTPRHPKMKMPKVHDSLSWGKWGNNKMSAEDSALVSAAMSNLNRFSNDGNFMAQFEGKESKISKSEARLKPKSAEFASGGRKEDSGALEPAMSVNQLAANSLQLRMKGKHEEAEKLMKEAENIKERQNIGTESSRRQVDGTTTRFIMHDVSASQKQKEGDGDLHLAQKIMQNHRYGVSNQELDEEYDYDDGPRRKTRKKGGGGNH